MKSIHELRYTGLTITNQVLAVFFFVIVTEHFPPFRWSRYHYLKKWRLAIFLFDFKVALLREVPQ
jgi:hypothetical protein